MLYPIRRNLAQSIYFPLITAGGTDFQDTWTPAAGETQVITPGNSPVVANANGTPAHEANGIWSLALTAAETDADVIIVTLSDGATDIEDQSIICDTRFGGQLEANQGIIIGEVDNATFTPSTTQFEAFRRFPNATEETTADHYLSRNILFTSGVLTGAQKNITDYELANSKEKFTVTAFVEAPGDGDRFVIL